MNPTLKIDSSDAFTKAVKNISLLRKPLNGGRPAMAKLPTTVNVKEIGMNRTSPPSFRISRVPVSWSMIPITMKRAPLNVE